MLGLTLPAPDEVAGDVEVSRYLDGFGRFPRAELVDAAVAMWPRETYPDRHVQVRVGDRALDANQRRRCEHWQQTGEVRPWLGEYQGAVAVERQQTEGPRFMVEVAPGLVRFRRSDPARRQRSLERAERDRAARVAQIVERARQGLDPEPEGGVRRVRVWSAKSRSLMTARLAEFDYTPFLDGDAVPAMITLTLPGDWLTVAPSALVARRLVDAWRKRFERDWGVPLVGIWKREFQRRGAPHWHILMVPPTGTLDGGETFAAWLSRSWSEVVGHPDPEERALHRLAGTGIDYAQGARALDPRRLGAYFAKHGLAAVKEYQNEAPWAWVHEPGCEDGSCDGCADEGIGRFWGYWRLGRRIAGVEVAEDRYAAGRRTARRWADANRYQVKVYRWRKTTVVDRETGEIGWRWRRRATKVWVRRMTGPAGYLVVNDGPGFAEQLARAAHLAVIPRSGCGPVGFLP